MSSRCKGSDYRSSDPRIPLVRSALALILLLLSMPGCDRRLDPYVPSEQEPPPIDRPLRIPGFEAATPRSAPPPAAAAPGASIRGSVRLAGGVEQVGTGVLFVIARGPAGGPPLAVKRLSADLLPVDFAIGPGDVMLQGRPFAGPIQLSARLDRDGDPLSRGAGDLVAESVGPLEPGATGVVLELRPSGG